MRKTSNLLIRDGTKKTSRENIAPAGSCISIQAKMDSK